MTRAISNKCAGVKPIRRERGFEENPIGSAMAARRQRPL